MFQCIWKIRFLCNNHSYHLAPESLAWHAQQEISIPTGVISCMSCSLWVLKLLNKFFLKKKILAFHRHEKLKLTVTYWQAWFDSIINAQSRPMYQRWWRFQEGEHMSGGPEGHPWKKQAKYLSRVWTMRSVMWLHLWRFPRTSLSC